MIDRPDSHFHDDSPESQRRESRSDTLACCSVGPTEGRAGFSADIRQGAGDHALDGVPGRVATHDGLGSVAPSEGEMVALLEGTTRFRVLRALPTFPEFDPRTTLTRDHAIGVAIDVETTGLNPASAEVLELGMARFVYRKWDGRILGLLGTFSGLRQPSSPIPPEVTRITGIDDAMVAGRTIDAGEVAAFLTDARVVMAHNARFDRPFVEAHWAGFARLPWACSCTEVDWAGEGYEGFKLGHLLLQAGYFHKGHRALDDALTMLHLLALPLPATGRTGLAALLEQARVPTLRIWAERAPYEVKDRLKARGYRWSDGSLGLPRSWYRDLPEDAAAEEVEFLRREIYWDTAAGPRTVASTALDRFTGRAGAPNGTSA